MADVNTGVFSLEGKGLKLTTPEDIKEYVQQIRDFENLTEIVLSGNTIGSEAAKELASVLPEKTQLQVANFSDIFTGRLREDVKESVKVLCDSLIDLPHLRVLNLSDNAFGPVGAESMFDFLSKNDSLEELYLNNNGLGIQGGKTIAKAFVERHERHEAQGKDSTLKVIVMGRNRLENGSSKELAHMLSKLKSLTSFRVPQNGIRPEGIETLMKGLALNENLAHLDLQDNTFTSSGSKALADALPNWKNLEILNVSDSLLGPEGGMLVADALRENKQLKKLHLQYNEIENDGAEALSEVLCHLPDLEVLELNGNRFRHDSHVVEKIKVALSDKKNDDILGSLSDMEELTSDEEEEEEEDEEEEEEESVPVIVETIEIDSVKEIPEPAKPADNLMEVEPDSEKTTEAAPVEPAKSESVPKTETETKPPVPETKDIQESSAADTTSTANLSVNPDYDNNARRKSAAEELDDDISSLINSMKSQLNI
ncbi:Ran GTPase-activating protein 1 [Smittium mucronatum]|uniref:Ran GTPase-activating protein 1 n=1 Tax=Smittium mucronatum TaxID=133383 RepID=A0A1R0GM76_9FUNG|nr:Ran GTPase-activating protein 1 [Smittium mucronatum]